MSDILQKICADRKLTVAEDKLSLSDLEIRKLAEKINKISNFQEVISNKHYNKEIAIIAEIKQKSPSQGMLVADFNVADIAKKYKLGGAAALSVLTEQKYFAGKDEYINIAQASANLPILRKDFIIDPYQIYQAKYIGSDAILLIMSCLSLEQAKEFEQIAHSLHMDVLVETHNEKEIEQALELNTKLIGINNRNLKTLDISLNNIKNLSNFIPQDKIIICESGINSKDDLQAILELDIYCFLIGGYFMKDINDIQNKLANLTDLVLIRK